MRTLAFLAMALCMAWAVGEYAAVDPSAPPLATPGFMLSTELSRDNGNIQSAWVYINGAGTYAGDQYEKPSGYWHLIGIKYFVWSQGWPDSAYQGFEVACWWMVGDTPADVIWPADGQPVYNPNTGGNWISQSTGYASLPDGFVVGIGFLYAYPANDGFGVDNTGVGPYDWSYTGGAWQAAPYGKGSARALISNWMDCEPVTLGSLRALYR